jgi:outer membrane murein-binding lipoprotein Lpp
MSQQPAPGPPVPTRHVVAINDETTFSWKVLASVLGVAVLAGGLFMKTEFMRRDIDQGRIDNSALRSEVDALKAQAAVDRGRLDVQAATLGEVRAVVLEVRSDVREVLRSQPAFPVRSARGTLPP